MYQFLPSSIKFLASYLYRNKTQGPHSADIDVLCMNVFQPHDGSPQKKYVGWADISQKGFNYVHKVKRHND